MKYNILLVDDDEKIKMTFDLILENEFQNDVHLTWVKSGQEAIQETLVNPDRFAVVLMDYDLKTERRDLSAAEKENLINGVEAARIILERNPNIQIVMQSGDKTRDLVLELMKLGIGDFIDKPIKPKEAAKVLRTYFFKYDKHFRPYEKSNGTDQDRGQFISQIHDGLIGESESIYKICRRIESLKESNSRVLITGENGTGKELIAQAIHMNSLRSKKPFVAVNVGAISKNLMESEMFGHEKGAFTGAVRRKLGKFQQADGGTLFLDEIGELPLELQAKLLRVLQEDEVEMVGGEKPIKIDARIIAATNIDLEQAVAEGKFREDLYHRLKVVPISVPPLRERPEDIPLLIDAGIEKFWPKVKTIKNSVIQILKEYSWPGNVRELMNLMERLGSIPSKVISEEHLDARMLDEENERQSAKLFEQQYQVLNLDDIEGIKMSMQKKFIESELPKYSSVRKAAIGLGASSYSSFQRLAKKLNIDAENLVGSK